MNCNDVVPILICMFLSFVLGVWVTSQHYERGGKQ